VVAIVSRSFRSAQNAISALCLGFLGVTLLTYAFGKTTPFVGAAALGVAGFAISGFALRVVFSGIIAADSGLKVRGWHRTERVGWDEVVGFRRASASAMNSSVYLAVELRNGTLLKTAGLVTSKSSQFGDRVLSELEAMRQTKSVLSAPRPD
jgi:hypothetical protein